MATRRGFLGTIAAAVAAPAVGKTDNAVVGYDPIAKGLDLDWETTCSEERDLGKLRRFLRKSGLPEWRRQEIARVAAQYWKTTSLRPDPDIEALRSVSATHKRRMNIKKEFESQCQAELADHIFRSLGRDSPREKFRKKFGIWL